MHQTVDSFNAESAEAYAEYLDVLRSDRRGAVRLFDEALLLSLPAATKEALVFTLGQVGNRDAMPILQRELGDCVPQRSGSRDPHATNPDARVQTMAIHAMDEIASRYREPDIIEPMMATLDGIIETPDCSTSVLAFAATTRIRRASDQTAMRAHVERALGPNAYLANLTFVRDPSDHRRAQ